jgi:hypothetical protein
MFTFSRIMKMRLWEKGSGGYLLKLPMFDDFTGLTGRP